MKRYEYLWKLLRARLEWQYQYPCPEVFNNPKFSRHGQAVTKVCEERLNFASAVINIMESLFENSLISTDRPGYLNQFTSPAEVNFVKEFLEKTYGAEALQQFITDQEEICTKK
jgi:hypothetical protein